MIPHTKTHLKSILFGRDESSTIYHFIGVVEDRQDPAQQGRVRVRCFGYHSDDRTKIPTDHLPWATVLMPVTSAGVTGIGASPTGIVVGSYVWGFFLDGSDAQKPLVFGTLSSSSVATMSQIDSLGSGNIIPSSGGSGYSNYGTIQNTSSTSVSGGDELESIVQNSDSGTLEGVTTQSREQHISLLRQNLSSMTRHVDLVVLHCTASSPSSNYGVEEIRQYHVVGRAQEGLEPFSDIGYHIVIRRSGEIQIGRPFNTPGAHARGYNTNSLGVVLVRRY